MQRATGSASSRARSSAASSARSPSGSSSRCGLLRLRLPEGARGRLRPARLPVDLAARALRARVPLRAAERAADGLLPARRARPRGAAARDRRCCRRTSTAATVECRVERSDGELAVRIGLGYVQGVRGGRGARRWSPSASAAAPIADAGDLAARSGAGRDTLERLAWAGACDEPRAPAGEALWQTGRRRAPGSAVPRRRAARAAAGAAGGAARCASSTRWERLVADYGSIRISLGEHPMALLRPELAARPCCAAATSSASADGARGRGRGPGRRPPAPGDREGRRLHAARGRVRATINLIVPPPVYERHRLPCAPSRSCSPTGRLERREGVINVVVTQARRPRAARPAARRGKHIEPPPGRETGRRRRGRDGVVDRRAGAGRRGRTDAAAAGSPQLRGRRGR